MKEENESKSPSSEGDATDESGAITELPQRDAATQATDDVRGGASLPPDKRKQIGQDM